MLKPLNAKGEFLAVVRFCAGSCNVATTNLLRCITPISERDQRYDTSGTTGSLSGEVYVNHPKGRAGYCLCFGFASRPNPCLGRRFIPRDHQRANLSRRGSLLLLLSPSMLRRLAGYRHLRLTSLYPCTIFVCMFHGNTDGEDKSKQQRTSH